MTESSARRELYARAGYRPRAKHPLAKRTYTVYKYTIRRPHDRRAHSQAAQSPQLHPKIHPKDRLLDGFSDEVEDFALLGSELFGHGASVSCIYIQYTSVWQEGALPWAGSPRERIIPVWHCFQSW